MRRTNNMCASRQNDWFAYQPYWLLLRNSSRDRMSVYSVFRQQCDHAVIIHKNRARGGSRGEGTRGAFSWPVLEGSPPPSIPPPKTQPPEAWGRGRDIGPGYTLPINNHG